LREGKADTAERIYAKILEERPGYPHAYHGLARVELRKGNLQEAVRLYRSAIKALDEPAFHEELGEALQAMGRVAESENEYSAAEEGYRKESSGGEDNAMEYAHFLAAHDRQLDEALRLAQGAFQRRPSIHASEILALALHKTGRDAEALGAITSAQRLGTRDAGMHYLAGCILDRLGRTGEAQREISAALSLDPNFSILEGPKAAAMLQRHARKNALASAR
jgi:Flp pilus assembly protein TadD